MTTSKFIGAGVNWQEQVESREVSENEKRITLKYYTQTETGFNLTQFSACPVAGYSSLKLNTFRRSVVANANGQSLFAFDIEYVHPDLLGGSTDGNSGGVIKEAWNLVPNVQEKPLEEHPNYAVCWNHYLLKHQAASSAPPSDWDSTTSLKTASVFGNDEFHEYLWSDTGVDLPANFSIVEERTKSFDTWFSCEPQVIRSRTYGSYSSAVSAASALVKKEAPAKKFGIGGGSWLRLPGTVSQSGREYIVEDIYIWKPDAWDSEIYS